MRKLSRLPESRDIPIQIPHPLMQIRVSRADIPDVGLEMLDVDGVEADYGRVESDVCFGYVGAVVVGAGGFGEVGFGEVEG